MKRLSKADEQRILSALDDVRSLLDEGQSPNDAITKVAAEYQLRPSFVQLMINAVNTGRTNQKRIEAGSDAIKAAEDFEIADPEVILERLFPTKVKKASEISRQTVVSPEYTSQAGAERLWKEKAAAAKLANAKIDLNKINGEPVRKPDPYPGDISYLMKKAAGLAERCKQRIETARREVQALHDKIAGLVGTLVEYFQQPGALPFKEVQANAEPLFGRNAKLIIDIVGQRVPKSIKSAAACNNKPIDYGKPPYSTLRQCTLLTSEYHNKKAEYNKIVKEATEEADKALLPFAIHPVLTGSVLDGGTYFIEKLAAGATATPSPWYEPARLTFRMIKERTISPFSRRTYDSDDKLRMDKDDDEDGLEDLTDPAYESRIRNIQAQSTLVKLMSGPFSKYDPKEVMEAYNRVAPFIPEGSQHEALIQDAIQKQLAGGPGALDTFAIKELVDINRRLREARGSK